MLFVEKYEGKKPLQSDIMKLNDELYAANKAARLNSLTQKDGDILREYIQKAKEIFDGKYIMNYVRDIEALLNPFISMYSSANTKENTSNDVNENVSNESTDKAMDKSATVSSLKLYMLIRDYFYSSGPDMKKFFINNIGEINTDLTNVETLKLNLGNILHFVEVSNSGKVIFKDSDGRELELKDKDGVLLSDDFKKKLVNTVKAIVA